MAEQISSVYFGRATIGAVSNFHSFTKELIEETTPEALHIEGLFPQYKTASETLAGLVNRRTAFVSTALLDEADRLRDRGCGTIVSMVNACKSSLVESKRNAAAMLAPQLVPYKGIRSHEYSKQTAEINGMLSVLDAEANKPFVEALNLKEDIEALRLKASDFDKLFKQRATEMEARMGEKNLNSQEVLKEVNTRYNDLVQRVNAFAIVSPDETINGFISRMNAQIAVFARISGTKPSGGSTVDPTDPGTTDPGEDDDKPVVV